MRIIVNGKISFSYSYSLSMLTLSNDLLATDSSRYFAQLSPMIVNYFDIFVGTATHWEDKVASISKEGVKPGDTLVSQLQLPVPSLPQTMQSCSCLKISYLLRVIYSISVHGDL